MPRPYSLDLRRRIIASCRQGIAYRQVGDVYGVSASCAVKLAARARQTGSLEPDTLGRPPGSGKLEPYRDFLIDTVTARPDITMPELAARLEEVHAVVPHPASLSRFLRKAGFTYKKTLIASERQRGVVTLSWIERNWPITANAEAWDFNDLACCSIAEIWLIALNVTTPMAAHSTGLELDQFVTTKTFSSRAIGVFYFPQNCNCRARARSISTAKRFAIFA